MEKAKLSRRIATIKYNHEFNVTPVNRMHLLPKRIQVGQDQWSLAQLKIQPVNSDAFVADKTVELMVCWLRLNVASLSREVREFWDQCYAKSNKEVLTRVNERGALMKQAYSEMMKFRKTGLEKIAGTTLYLRERPEYAKFLMAWRLATLSHPFVKFVLRNISKYRGVNALDFLSPAKIMEQIDFPYTSVANMLTALGFAYVRDLEYIDKGWVLTPYGNGLYTIYFNADLECFKCGSEDAMLFLINNDLVEHSMTREEAFQLQIKDFSNADSVL